MSRSLWKHPVQLVACGFGSGLVPVAPGTCGSLVGVAILLPLQRLSLPWYIAVVVGLFVVGIWLCGSAARALGAHDHPAIVWDEIVGLLVTMAGAPAGWPWVVLGFVLFRLFDIVKPWPIGLIDRRLSGGLGIMLDDVLAGLYGLAGIQLARVGLNAI